MPPSLGDSLVIRPPAAPMKHLMACILLLALPATAQAADWVRVGTPDQHQHFYDRSKLTIEGEQITYWRRVVFRTPQPAKTGKARMAMYRERIDCDKHAYRTLGYLLYAQDGNVLENVYTPEAPSEPIIPETVGDRFETLMCLIVEQDAASRAALEAAVPAMPATPEAIRAEIERLEARLQELNSQLTAGSPAQASQSLPTPEAQVR